MSVIAYLPIIRNVGLNGQISLGKKYAGRQVILTELDDGSIILKLGKFVPDNEMWLYKNGGEKKLDDALEWLASSNRKDNYNEIVEQLENV